MCYWLSKFFLAHIFSQNSRLIFNYLVNIFSWIFTWSLKLKSSWYFLLNLLHFLIWMNGNFILSVVQTKNPKVIHDFLSHATSNSSANPACSTFRFIQKRTDFYHFHCYHFSSSHLHLWQQSELEEDRSRT